MNIAIFPGSFSPVHIGHLMLAETALLQFNLDKIVFILSPNPPNKLNQNNSLSLEQRIKLLNIALKTNKNFKLDLRELDRDISYTIFSLREIQAEYKVKKIKMILGLDSFLSLSTWHCIDEIKDICEFLVAKRPNYQPEAETKEKSLNNLGFNWAWLNNLPLPISSSLIRQLKAEKAAYRYLLPAEVYEAYAKAD